MKPTGRLPEASSKPPRAVTIVEMLVSTASLALLMLVMIEAVFLFW